MVTVRVAVEALGAEALGRPTLFLLPFGRPAFFVTFLLPFGRPAFFVTFLLPFGRPAFFVTFLLPFGRPGFLALFLLPFGRPGFFFLGCAIVFFSFWDFGLPQVLSVF
jgi:hypothetical protein